MLTILFVMVTLLHPQLPVKHVHHVLGIVSNWDNMERYWQRCIYQYLQIDPEEHNIMLTEPPMNTPENREYTAEIMFEIFNVPVRSRHLFWVLLFCVWYCTQLGIALVYWGSTTPLLF